MLRHALETVHQAPWLGGRGADVACDFVGFPPVVPEGLEMLRYGRTYLEIGRISRGPTVELHPSTLVWGSKRTYLLVAGLALGWTVVLARQLPRVAPPDDGPGPAPAAFAATVSTRRRAVSPRTRPRAPRRAASLRP